MNNEDGTPYLGTRYHFLIDAPGFDRQLCICSGDICGWLADPERNGCGGTFSRLVGMAHGSNGNWIWKCADYDAVQEMVNNG